MTIRIPIIGQSTTTSFVPQQNVQAVQIADPRGEALQGLGKSMGEFADGLDKVDKAHPAVAFKADQDNNTWALQAYAQCVRHGSDLTAHLAGISTPGDGTTPAADSVIAGANAGADASPLAHPATLLNTPNPIQAMITGLMSGGSGGAGNPGNPNAAANDPSSTDPSVHGTTGAWINGYDLGARAAIAAAPSKSVAASLAAQCGTDRLQGARAIMGLEAQGNVQQRQSTALSAAQTIATYGVAADPATLPQALAFFQRHPIRIEGSAADQASFDAGLRQTLVGAGIKTLLARDPQGTLRQLQGETGEKGKNEEDGTGEPEPAAALHPAIAALTPEERASYLPQAVRAVVVADSNFRAGVRQGAAAASQSYLATGNAANPPRPEDFTRAFGAEEGQRQYQQMQEAQQSGQIRQQILPLPDNDLQRMLDEAQPRQRPGDVISPPQGHGPGFRALEGAEGATMVPDRIAVAPSPGSRSRSLDGIVPEGTRMAPDHIEVAPSRPGLLERQIQSLRRQRANDPIQAAQDASSYGVKPIDFTQAAASGAALGAALQGRAQVADDIARAYNVAPAALSQAEVRQLAVALQGRKPDEQQVLLKQISDGINNLPLTQDTLRALSVHEPVIALAGFHQANESTDSNNQASVPSAGSAVTTTTEGENDTGPIDSASAGARGAWGGTGKLDAAELLLRGNALLRPQDDGAEKRKPLPMPPFQEMWHSFSDLTGDAHASQSGAQVMQFAGTNAIYAALKAQDGDNGTVLDMPRMHASAFISKYGNATPQEAGLSGTAYTSALSSMQGPDGDMPPGRGILNLVNTSMPMSGAGAAWIARKMQPVAPSSSPPDNSNAASTALPGVPPLAPIDDHAVGQKQQNFVEGLHDLFTVTQVGNPASYTQSQSQTQLDISLAARKKLRDVGAWMQQDPSRGAAMLQRSAELLLSLDGSNGKSASTNLTAKGLDDAVARKGGNAQQILNTVKGLVDLIQHGDPQSTEVARQIGAGLQFVLSPENSQIAPGLLLGMLSIDGKPAAGIEKALTAAQQIEPGHAAYVWQSLTQPQMAAALSGLEGVGAAVAFKSGGVVGKIFAKLQKAAEGLGNRVRDSVPSALPGELVPAGGPGKIQATPPQGIPAIAADAVSPKKNSNKNGGTTSAGTAASINKEAGNPSNEGNPIAGTPAPNNSNDLQRQEPNIDAGNSGSLPSDKQKDTTRLGVVRDNDSAWRNLKKHWDEMGYGDILSAENKAQIAKGRRPKVDEEWIKYFPEDAGLKDEKISPHHIGGHPLTLPLPKTRHYDAHMPGGYRYNKGGPGSAAPFYPAKESE